VTTRVARRLRLQQRVNRRYTLRDGEVCFLQLANGSSSIPGQRDKYDCGENSGVKHPLRSFFSRVLFAELDARNKPI